MDIGINTEAVCEQMQEELLDKYDVIFCNIETQGSACIIDAVIPKTDAEFSVCINDDQTYSIVRVNPDEESRFLLDWAKGYLHDRGFLLAAD